MFPVGPDTPLSERPYMQRPGGAADGSDLVKSGLKGVGQGKAQEKTKIDEKYEKLEKDGSLASAPWAKNLPWTNSQAANYKSKTNSSPSKKVETKKNSESEPPAEKKKLFGLW